MPKTVPTAAQMLSVDARQYCSYHWGARARAELGVETVRYYQRRRLLAVPHSAGRVRRYPTAVIDRIRFIKRSQNLGKTLALAAVRIRGFCGRRCCIATRSQPHLACRMFSVVWIIPQFEIGVFGAMSGFVFGLDRPYY